MRLFLCHFLLLFTLLGCEEKLSRLNPLGNFSNAFQQNAKPVISLEGPNPLVLKQGEEFVEPGFKAMSIEGKDITSKVVSLHFIEKSKIGEYFVRYNVSENGEKAIEVIRLVLVSSSQNVNVISFPNQGESPYEYLEYLPADYQNSTDSYPLVIFLHGIGESGGVDFTTGVRSGRPLENVLMNGPLKLVKLGKEFPAIIVHPQSLEWWNPVKIKKYLDFLKSKYRINSKKVYLTGLSMGGAGTWDFARAYPEEVAAIVPICGASVIGSISEAQPLVNIPFWAFHAKDDPVVTVLNSFAYMNLSYQAVTGKSDKLQDYLPSTLTSTKTVAFENRLNLIVYEGVNSGVTQDKLLTIYPYKYHDSWSDTYNQQKMWDWLWTKARP